jgi:cytidylate kinase
VTQEAEIRKAARHMISRYGDSALQEIDQRIRELRERGEKDAARTWVEIRQAVRAYLLKGSQGLN